MKKLFQVALLTSIVGMTLYGAMTQYGNGHVKCTREWNSHLEQATVKNNAIQTIKY